MKILVGTSGYSYQDWKGPFYPADINDRDMLAFYARRFPAVEINFTYYRLPAAKTIAAIVRKGPALTYAVKLTGEITHGRDASPSLTDDFRRGVAPMYEAGVLGCLLAQFPWNFQYSSSSLTFMEEIVKRFAGLDVVAEFRHASWAAPQALEALPAMGIGFCNVDEPRLKGLMPPTEELTSRIGYFRFHGRNAAKWFKHENAAERYTYLYAAAELEEWVPRIKGAAARAEKTFVFLNNHPLGQAVTNAQMLMEMLDLQFGEGDAALF